MCVLCFTNVCSSESLQCKKPSHSGSCAGLRSTHRMAQCACILLRRCLKCNVCSLAGLRAASTTISNPSEPAAPNSRGRAGDVVQHSRTGVQHVLKGAGAWCSWASTHAAGASSAGLGVWSEANQGGALAAMAAGPTLTQRFELQACIRTRVRMPLILCLCGGWGCLHGPRECSLANCTHVVQAPCGAKLPARPVCVLIST